MSPLRPTSESRQDEHHPGASADDRLHESRERFVALWGQMGANWGIPRTMAEVHAVLFITGLPMNTDEIIDFLQISRGNASMTLRNLIAWGIVQRVHVRGERKEYFQAEQDVWKLFRTILRERKKREVDPVLEELRQCRALTADVQQLDEDGRVALVDHNARLQSMLTFMELLDDIASRMTDDSGSGLQRAATTLKKV